MTTLVEADTSILATFGDTHTTSFSGLIKPVVKLEGGGKYQANRTQGWMWECWQDYCQEVKALKRKYKGKVTGVGNGDLVEGDTKKRTNQVATKNLSYIIGITAETLEPMYNVVDAMLFLKGTRAHDGELVELLARDCTISLINPDTEEYSWWEYIGYFGGKLFDITHHASFGQLPWTEKNALSRLAVELMLKYSGQRIPDVAIRSHNHRKGDTYDNYPIRVVALPCWQGHTEWLYQRSPVRHSDIGGYIFVTKNGNLIELIKKEYEAPKGKIWRIPELQNASDLIRHS